MSNYANRNMYRNVLTLCARKKRTSGKITRFSLEPGSSHMLYNSPGDEHDL